MAKASEIMCLVCGKLAEIESIDAINLETATYTLVCHGEVEIKDFRRTDLITGENLYAFGQDGTGD